MPFVNKDQILFVSLTNLNNKFTCEQRTPAYKDFFGFSLEWSLKTGVTVIVIMSIYMYE